MAAKPDYYDILGISKGASAAEIKSAYRKQALEWHPDKHKDQKEAAEKRFKEINEAYQVLSDDQKRGAYDQYGHDAFTPGGSPGAGGFGGAGGFPGGGPSAGSGFGSWKVYTSGGGSQGGGGFSSKGGPASGWDFGDPFDIFEQFFGGGNPYGRQQRVPRYSITIDFLEAVKGVEKTVNIEGKSKTIKIPAGVDEGSRIQFNDFILSINVKPSNIFERDGVDIYVNVEIPFSMATLGGELEVPTVEGDIRIKVRPGTQSGSMLRLRGKGITKLRTRGKGDEYVKIVVSVPEKLTRDQKNLIKELEESGL